MPKQTECNSKPIRHARTSRQALRHDPCEGTSDRRHRGRPESEHGGHCNNEQDTYPARPYAAPNGLKDPVAC